jgi:FkbM family methyltransferase
MAIKGFKRYLQLAKNVTNPVEYFTGKRNRHKKPLVFTTKPGHITFHVPASIYLVFKEIFMNDVYAIDDLIKKIPKNPVIVDIGANVGFFDILMLSKLPAAAIYAYEPLAANVDTLKKIIDTNPSIQQSISLYQYAVTGLPKEALYLYMENTEDSQVVASVFSDFNANNTKKISVPCITLTDIINQHKLENIDILKIDCEGSEYDIIYNTDPDLIRKAKIIALEVHDVDADKNNFPAMKDYLISLGYKINAEPINDFCFAVEAIRS